MLEEAKQFSWRIIGTAFAAFLTALVPAFQQFAQDNWKGLLALALINGLLAAINTFLNKKTRVKEALGLKR